MESFLSPDYTVWFESNYFFNPLLLIKNKQTQSSCSFPISWPPVFAFYISFCNIPSLYRLTRFFNLFIFYFSRSFVHSSALLFPCNFICISFERCRVIKSEILWKKPFPRRDFIPCNFPPVLFEIPKPCSPISCSSNWIRLTELWITELFFLVFFFFY